MSLVPSESIVLSYVGHALFHLIVPVPVPKRIYTGSVSGAGARSESQHPWVRGLGSTVLQVLCKLAYID
jgi:hypothetical protein